MLRLTVSTEEYLMIGEDIKLIFLGGTGKHLRVMIDAPREKNIVRSTVLEKNITDPEERANLPKYYAQEEHPEKYVKKADPKPKGTVKKPKIVIVNGKAGSGNR
ncbi:MAG: carbon storage regulator [Clostridium sp.]|nr:carbon storage regulator [Candidatus Gastranaerophilales bacterium]MCM1528311.1 carbon storage regulator [Bacteroides sp.]MCM1563692.1 carbon storage regulator [Clostridium sp.]